MDNSIAYSEASQNRIGISNEQFVVLSRTCQEMYHGHVRTWAELSSGMRAALIKAGKVTPKGKII